ncbi:thymine dioxygenase [Mycena galericulata]|nr:thymine dioxygenase [Mycena galericulata]
MLPDALRDSGISVVDFSPFLDGSNKPAVAEAILSSFKRAGFVYLLNHGIPPDRVSEMFAVSKRFFAQPMEVKESAPHPPSGTHHRGYSSPGRENISDIKSPKPIPTLKEHFECGREGNEVMPNIWLPDDVLPGFKESCLDFFWLCYEVELNILRALALGLGLDENYFGQYHAAPDGNQLRLLHYARQRFRHALRSEEVERINAHSDYVSITLLLQDKVGGLEVEDPHVPGLFHPAPPVPHALIVNAGDLMMRWSNDTIRSTVHRVRAPSGSENSDGMIPERYSIPYFCCADLDSVVDCLPGTWDAQRP